ncbi:hypothetical protein [Allomuricauda sp. M10]|uniref:hypothetical protein n=1 Tax=Allomuricauda sp. M10 TaxID=2683292 RepID=UPI001D1906B1|nr:hypothetical protein [Muricauda sp. M10]
MSNTILKILASLGLAVILNGLEYFLKSDFLSTFIEEDLVGLLLTLLAINTATSTVISSKLEDIAQRTGADFSDVVKEIKFSLIEQIVMIILSIILLISLKSSFLLQSIDHIGFVINLALSTILIYSIEILRDTGVTIFDIIIELNKKDDGEEE